MYRCTWTEWISKCHHESMTFCVTQKPIDLCTSEKSDKCINIIQNHELSTIQNVSLWLYLTIAMNDLRKQYTTVKVLPLFWFSYSIPFDTKNESSSHLSWHFYERKLEKITRIHDAQKSRWRLVVYSPLIKNGILLLLLHSLWCDHDDFCCPSW